MPNAPLRLTLLSLLVALHPLAAQEGPPEDDLLQAITSSKLHYDLAATGGPIRKPVEELHCPARSIATRVVRGPGGTKQLQPWDADTAPHLDAATKLFAAQRYAAAGEIYRQALKLDPTLPQAHRFLADVLAKLGRVSQAQDEYVKALVYDPSSDGAREGLAALGAKAGFTLARHELLPPEGALGEAEEGRVPIALGPEQKQWVPYFLCKAVWRNEPAYRGRRLGKEGEGVYSWTVQEEAECLVSYLVGNLSATETEIQEAARKARPDAPPAEVPVEQVLAAAPPLLRHLKEVADAKLLPGYALFAVLGRRCPAAIAVLPDRAQADLERYIRRFVIVPSGVTRPAGR
ncbi:MAG TPA: tetratricopeptide repeat protein [Thermoanaerobaculia bacterium]|nr:tetratricopeptide repeat protein [Thermoanaerobaculia bacterium]